MSCAGFNKIDRRKFIKLALGSTAYSLLCPRFTMAQAVSNTGGKNLICINLYGGLDGLAAFPYAQGTLANTMRSTCRPTLAPVPGTLPIITGQVGRPNPLGYHSALNKLFSIASSKLAVIQNYGIPGDPGRSHDTCQNLMSLGQSEMSNGDMRGFLARVMDLKNWQSMQYWALYLENPADINTTKQQPMVVSNLSEFDIGRLGWERDVDRDLANSVAEVLFSQPTNIELAKNYQATARQSYQGVAVVQNQIVTQAVGENSAGNYTDSYFGNSVRDVAKILKAKVNSSSLGLGGKDLMFLLGQGGYDTHSDQASPDSPEGNLSGLLTELGQNLSVLFRDLQLFGILNNTIVVVYSEFGRTVFENGTAGDFSVGTDHGHGNNTFVMGGPIKPGVYGEPPTNAQLISEYNALNPRIDYRDIFSDIFTWMNVAPTAIFPSSYTYRRVGII